MRPLALSEKMNNGYNPKSFWNERFGKSGHTGELDTTLYAYDQPHRLRAVGQALSRAKVSMNSNMKILDIGCGTGDLIESLMKHGEPEITGLDISDKTIEYAKRRFAAHEKVRLLTAGVEEMDFPSSSFDMVIGINILQHIADEQVFFKAIENIVRVTKMDGHILVMDFSPIKVANRQPAPYVVYRSRREYIDAFKNGGCKFISEFGLPRIGVRLYRAVGKVGRFVQLLGFQSKLPSEVLSTNEASSLQNPRVGHLIRILLLELSRPLDYLLAPLPSRYTDMRILIFQVASR